MSRRHPSEVSPLSEVALPLLAALTLLAAPLGCGGAVEPRGGDAARSDAAVVGDGPATSRDALARADGPLPPRRDGAADGPSAPVDQGGGAQPDLPPPRPYPDVSAAKINCSKFTIGDFGAARAIYDKYFGDALPTTDSGFGWHVDSKLLSEALVERVAFFPPSTGLSNKTYHQYFDFDVTRFSRDAGKRNWDIFAALKPSTAVDAPYERYNPTDYVPATATHYGRSSTSDVIANQFVFRLACYRAAMEKALKACPDCADVIVPLSGNDIHKVFEVRFARVKNGALEVSRPFKVISVDSSGSIAKHAAVWPYLFARLPGKTLRAKWRGEISGRMARNLGTYGGPTPMLIRLVK